MNLTLKTKNKLSVETRCMSKIFCRIMLEKKKMFFISFFAYLPDQNVQKTVLTLTLQRPAVWVNSAVKFYFQLIYIHVCHFKMSAHKVENYTDYTCNKKVTMSQISCSLVTAIMILTQRGWKRLWRSTIRAPVYEYVLL